MECRIDAGLGKTIWHWLIPRISRASQDCLASQAAAYVGKLKSVYNVDTFKENFDESCHP